MQSLDRYDSRDVGRYKSVFVMGIDQAIPWAAVHSAVVTVSSSPCSEVLAIWMMLPSPALSQGPACPRRGWRAAPVQQATRGSSVSAAPLGTVERPLDWGPTAPACLAPAMDTARPVILKRVCVTAGITRRALTVRSAVMGTTEMQQRAQPWTASPARAPAAPAVLLFPARRRLCAPAARQAPRARGVSCVMMPILETHWVKTGP